MASYSTNEFKSGLKIMIDNDPCAIIENEFVKPGKGQAFNRVKFRNLKTGRVIERTFKSGESVEAADVVEASLQYLYNDGAEWHFMDEESYEQFTANWLKEQDTCTVTLWNGSPILVVPPNFVNLTVSNTDPGLRGDTASGATKPAVVETGATIKVPLFVEEGELIKIDTRTGDYVSRVKE